MQSEVHLFHLIQYVLLHFIFLFFITALFKVKKQAQDRLGIHFCAAWQSALSTPSYLCLSTALPQLACQLCDVSACKVQTKDPADSVQCIFIPPVLLGLEKHQVCMTAYRMKAQPLQHYSLKIPNMDNLLTCIIEDFSSNIQHSQIYTCPQCMQV